MTKTRSDHFDGHRFINPTLPKRSAPSLRTVFKMVREPRSPWPARVETKGVHRLHEPRAADEVAITFVNHATFLIQTGGTTILTDPIWSERASPFRRIGPKRVRRPGVAFAELPPIDVVLLSHNHYDHLDIATLARLRRRCDPAVLAAAGDARLVGPLGFKSVRELDWWDAIEIGDGLKITFVPAQHFSARGLFDRQKSLWGGYMIERLRQCIFFGGDSGYSSHFTDIRARLGAPDLALLGIGAYEPRWFMQPMHMNPAEAVRAHRDLGSRQSIGMHFGTFQLSAEAIDQPQADLRRALIESGLAESEFITLHEGETRIYPATS
ncbi:MAG TPA: MBL fold metallo-hydrolase [Xanthobacteraceae bacterium]|jgi:L-ascorbate metabolism protein UlaG (beta-lactamase superfamily)